MTNEINYNMMCFDPMKLNYSDVYLQSDLLLYNTKSYNNEPTGVHLYSLHMNPITESPNLI